VPNLDFYAVDADVSAVLDTVFNLELFRVFEAFSEPDTELREFAAADEIPDSAAGLHLMLHAHGSGPDPTARRIDLLPVALGDATFRYCCEGWGLIQLYFGHIREDHGLQWSHTNHNTSKRAAKWFDAAPQLGNPARWGPDPSDRRAKLIVPTPLGLDQMARSDAILAGIEDRHAQVVGADAYAEFKRLFRQIARQQRVWRDSTTPDTGESAGF
jgi:hypothetical protein